MTVDAQLTPSSHPPKITNTTVEGTEIDSINSIAVENPIIIENSDITLSVEISICKKPVKLLVDTGAHASILSSKLILSNVLYYPDVKYCLVGINGPGNTVKTHGAAYGNITLCGVKLKHQFQIAGDDIYLNYDGILGLDFLYVFKANIDLWAMKLTCWLPPWHNIYELNERSEFENNYPNLFKVKIGNRLVYKKNTTVINKMMAIPKSENAQLQKKLGIPKSKKLNLTMQASINRLEKMHMTEQSVGNEIKLAPGVRNFKVNVTEPLLCKSKFFHDGVFMNDTIVDTGKNVISIINATNETISLPSMHIEFDNVKNYNIYRIKNHNEMKPTINIDKLSERKSKDRIEYIESKLDLSHNSNEECKLIKKLITEFNDIFYVEGDGMTFVKNCEHRIFTKPGTNPVNTKQYRIPHSQKEIVQDKIKEMLKDDVIEPSTSLWNSPLLIVPKKSADDHKEYRFCVDYKNLNTKTETQTFPMPNLDEELNKMSGCKIFSTFDIRSAFHQIKMHKPDKEKTAFTAGHQKFQFKRMPFGLKGSPITWQVYLTGALNELLSANVMAYMDDILAYTTTIYDHAELLVKIFKRLRENGLKLKIEKTKLFAKEIKYLGFVINKHGLQPDEKNIEVIKNFPQPKNLKEIQRFVGMASYFRKFIHQFAGKAKPLHALCKKNVDFIWSEQCEESFETLKKALITAPVLAFADFSRKFYISVDASFYSVGGYISNSPPPLDKPIEYFSKTLSDCQQNYSTTHKELLAIVLAIERFQHYIWGKQFVVHTDHEALTYLFSQNRVGSRLLRWKLMLSEYDFEIIHRKGTNNVVSDCLSRIPQAEMRYFHMLKNDTTRSILAAITRSRAKENERLTKSAPNKSFAITTCSMNEEPNTTFDIKKYDKIIFIIDDCACIPFKKLQLRLKKKIKLNKDCTYNLIDVNENFNLIQIPKINFNLDRLQTAIMEIFGETEAGHVERIAINFGISNFRTYFEIKAAFKEIFSKLEISLTFFIGTQVEVFEINDINEILNLYHTSILGGHRGFERMKNTIKKFFTWHCMNSDIKKFIENCAVCEKTKIHKHTHTPLQITSVANAPFQKIYIDFVGEINPNSDEGHKHILTVACDLSKYVVMVPVHDCTALTAAKVIVEEVCLVFNIPKEIVSDNGPAFISETFREMAKLLEIKHIKTTPYHPQSNAVERYHRTLGQYIRAYTQKQKSSWHRYIKFFTFSYNNTIHSATGYSPHMLVFGYEIELPSSINRHRPDYNYDTYKHELITQLKGAWERSRAMIEQRKMENKRKYDSKKHETLTLKRNDLVLLFNDRKKDKFDNKYEGPFRVEEIISSAVTKVKKGKKSIIIHNDKLRLAKANHGTKTPPELEDKQ